MAQTEKILRDSLWDRNGVIEKILKDTVLPPMVRIRQKLDSQRLENVTGELRRQLMTERIQTRIRPGMTVAITAGSRGIDCYQPMMKTLVDCLREHGAKPFLIPAMGSHGGGTAEGQKQMLESLGITEQSVGAPIRSGMEVTRIGVNCDGHPVYIDRCAAEADGIVVFNRVKPHTNFRGEYESGLMKMMTIGLGKNVGAAACHRLPMDDMPHNVWAFGSAVLKNAPVLFGLATVENAYDRVKRVAVLLPEEIPEVEKELQQEAKASMPRLFFDDLDVLIVDRIGKNFSGAGMDPNVTGISGNPHMQLLPRVQRRVVLGLSKQTHGNAVGLGLADFSTKRVFDRIDFDAVYLNNITSRSIGGGRLPLIMANDRLAIQAAIYTSDLERGRGPRIVRIPNTMQLDEIEISEALIPQAEARSELQIVSEKYDWTFDGQGNLPELKEGETLQ